MFLSRSLRIWVRRALRRFAPRPQTRRVVLHIGACKTGTTYIQATLDRNRMRLPLSTEVVRRRQRDLEAIVQATTTTRTESEATARLAEIESRAARIGHRFGRVRTLVITQERIPGPMPGARHLRGLYPFAHLFVPAIVRGLESTGARVHVVLYTRRFPDWQASLYRFRFRDQPDRRYNAARFREKNGLPANWKGYVGGLRKALGKTPLTVVSYERDRRSGLLGRALYEIIGLSQSEIAALSRLPPQNVSRAQTRHDRDFDGAAAARTPGGKALEN